LKGKRIGIDRKWKSSLEAANGLFENAMSLMKEHGAEFVEVDYSEEINALGKDEYEVLKYEFKHGLERYLSRSNSKMRSLKDIISFNNAHAERAMTYFGQDILESSATKGGLDSPEYLKALKKTSGGSRELLRRIIGENTLHAISGLTISPAGCIDLIYGDRFGDIYAATAAGISGFPHITVPCGAVFGLPVGISFFGDAYSEPELLRIAYAYEQASKMRKLPAFIPMLAG
jgi:amidase